MTATKDIQKVTQAALATVDSLNLEDLDYLGQRWPEMSYGHRCLAYAGLALISIPAQAAWASIGLVAVPVTASLLGAGLGVVTLIKSGQEDSEYDPDVDAEETITVPSEEVTEPDVQFTEPMPWGNLPNRNDEPVYADPLEKAQATGVPVQDVLRQDGITNEEIRAWGGEVAEALISATPRPAGTVFEEPPEYRPFDIAKYLALNPQPMLLTAAPRSGKGVIAAQMWREFKAANPQGIVWVLQPKYHPKEWGYWDGVDCLWGDMIENYQGDEKEVERISKEWTQFIKDWRALPQRPKMLIIDEGIKISCVAPKWFKNFLAPTVRTEASSGETDDRYLIYVSQSPLVADVGMSSGDRSCLGMTCLARPDKKDHLGAVLSSCRDIEPPADALYGHSGSPKQAVVYCSQLGEWHPLPEYPVYASSKPHPNNVAGRLISSKPAFQDSRFTEPSPWGAPASEPVDWDFEESSTRIEDIAPELSEKIAQLRRQENDARYQCAADFLESLYEIGDKQVVSGSDFSKTSWASRWNGKDGGISGRSVASLQPFIRNALKFGFLKEANEKYEVALK